MLSDVLSMYNGGDPLHHGTVEGLLEGGRERGGGGEGEEGGKGGKQIVYSRPWIIQYCRGYETPPNTK